jgi:hypothetical protein
MNSRTRTNARDLANVTAAMSRNFLLQAANLRDQDDAAINRFAHRFGYLVPQILKTLGSPPMPEGPQLLNLLDQTSFFPPWQMDLRNALRDIWRAPDLRTKEWVIFRMLEGAMFQHSNPPSDSGWRAYRVGSKKIRSLPPPTLFEQIANYLRRRLHRLKICPNKDCPAPYFFAVRSSQVYCSDVCALPFQRAFKRQWWAKHGARWRRERRGR